MTRGLVLGDRVVIAQDLVRDKLIQDHVYLWPGSDCGSVVHDRPLHEMPVLRFGETATVIGIAASGRSALHLEAVWLQVGDSAGWTWAAFLTRDPGQQVEGQ